jgi:hypothetical protein
MLLYAVALLPLVQGDSLRMDRRDRSTIRKAILHRLTGFPKRLKKGQQVLTISQSDETRHRSSEIPCAIAG